MEGAYLAQGCRKIVCSNRSVQYEARCLHTTW